MQLLPAHDDSGQSFVDFFNFIYWGYVCSTVLLGVSVRQGYFYFTKYHDRLALKVYVAFLLSAWKSDPQQGKTSLCNFRNPVFGGGKCHDPYYNIRVAIVFLPSSLSSVRISVIVAISALLALGGGITRIIVMLAPPPDATAQGIFNITNTFENGFAAVSDIVATIAMCFKFVETAMDTRRWDPSAIETTSDWLLKYVCFRMTSLLRRLMIYTVNRGIVVTSVQILTLVLYWHAPDKLYWMTFHMCVGKLYVNTLLAMLNSRRQLRSISGFMDHSERNEKPSTLVVHAIAHSANEMKASM